MYVIGLGNPGLSYKKTRHNAGFMFIDHMRAIGRPKRLCNSYLYKGNSKIEGFVKPMTYMNLSGNAVKCLLDKHKLNKDELIICHDDLDLPLGTLRIKNGGGSGGHKGLESIMEKIGSNSFLRLRIGISKVNSIATIDYVLQDFSGNELETLNKTFIIAKNAIYDIINIGVSKAQTKYNRRAYE